jgi:transposase-like protein
MTEDELGFLPLRVTRVGVGGKRSFDPADKRRLVEACLRPGASLSGLALKAGVNANQLHKWVQTLPAPDRAQRASRVVGVCFGGRDRRADNGHGVRARVAPRHQSRIILRFATLKTSGTAVGSSAQRREA